MAKIGSIIAKSITWPLPNASLCGFCCAAKAVKTACEVARAAMPSAKPNGGSVGGPFTSPVMAAKPLIDSAKVPKPARCE